MRRMFMTIVACMILLIGAGAIQAQIIQFEVLLGGQFEVPPVVTTGNGSGTVTYDTQTKMLTLNVSYQDMEGTVSGAHIHGPALVNQNAGVVWGLTVGSPIQDVLGPLSAAQEQALFADTYYINVHTDLHPGGEIRGQIQNGVVPVEERSLGQVKSKYE